jgi:hypothetical protein
MLVLLAAQATAGPILGLASGAILGVTRQGMTWLPQAKRFDLEQTMDLLPRFRRAAETLNWVSAVGCGAVVLAARWW